MTQPARDEEDDPFDVKEKARRWWGKVDRAADTAVVWIGYVWGVWGGAAAGMVSGQILGGSFRHNLSFLSFLGGILLLAAIFVLPVYLAFWSHRESCDRSDCPHQRAHGQIGVLSVPDSPQ